MNGSDHVAGVCAFRDGVHVADWKSDTGCCSVDASEYTCHRIGASVTATDIHLEGVVTRLAGILDDGVESRGGDGALRKGAPQSLIHIRRCRRPPRS